MRNRRREALGEFEHQLLLALLRLGGRSYSVPLVLELEARTRREVAPAAVYIALRRLEKRGYVSSERTSATDGERARRYFRVEPVAIERLRDSRASFERLWEGLGPVLERE